LLVMVPCVFDWWKEKLMKEPLGLAIDSEDVSG